MLRNKQQAQQQDSEEQILDLLQRASGDPQAFQELMVKSPPAARMLAEQMQGQKQAGFANDEQEKEDRLNANKATIQKLYRIQSLPEDQRQTAIAELVANPNDDIDETDIPFLDDPASLNAKAVEYWGADDAKAMFGSNQDAKKFSQGTGKMSGYSFDTSTGGYSINPELKAKLDEVKSLPALDAKTRQSINKDFTQLTKDTKLIRNTAKDLESLSKIKSGPASIAMVFKFMKALDPTSVVREGEFATAENSAGIPEALRNTYNKVMEGGRLGEKQIDQFVFAAKSLANSAIESSNTEVSDFINTFEDTLTEGFKKSLINRIPKTFDVGADESPKVTDSLSDQDLINQYGGG